MSQQQDVSSASSTKKETTAAKVGKQIWVAPSFDSFGDMSGVDQSSFKRPPVKRQKRSAEETSSTSSRTLKTSKLTQTTLSTKLLNSKMTWVEKYTPQKRTELAVHPKKIDDVFAWIREALQSSNKAPMLVLTGPPGTGKTATMRVAAKELGFQLREWITPVNSNIYTEDEDGRKRFQQGYKSEYDLVKDFMLKSSRYPSVLLGEETTHSVVLVEDLPLTFFRDPGALHDLLWEYSEDGRSPLVFIVGENSSFRKLFPDLVVNRLKMKTIEFNPVAMTIMTKFLQSIVQQESQNVVNKTFQSPPREVIDSIYESSCGDLRSAINTLQFACLRGTHNLTKVVSGKSQTSPSKSKKAKLPSNKEKGTELASIGGRDAPDDFFRTIGRVLYAKREKSEGGQGKLVHEPQDIVNNSIASSEFFTGFLHENYIAHFPVLKNLEQAADYLCLADVIMKSFQSNEKTLGKQLGLSVAVQGLMYCHPDVSSGAPRLGFRPQHKPRSTAAEKAYAERRERARHLFPNSHCSSYELLTELVPYIGQIGGSSCSTEAQLQFIESSRLESTGFRPPTFRSMSREISLLHPPGPGVPVNGMKTSRIGDGSEIEDDEAVIDDIDSD